MWSEIDLSQPRQAVYRSFTGEPGPCPQCGGRLLRSRQVYSVATRRGRKLRDSFIVKSDFGWFCGACPVVVINSQGLSEMLGHCLPHWDVGNEFCVQGIVDLEAIPLHKRHLPIGGDDNPLPLIAFEYPVAQPSRQPLSRKQRQQRRKLLRNLRAGVRERA